MQVKTGAWYLMRIRPYRTLENVIEGAVITFVDITSRKQLEAALLKLEVQALTESIVATVREPMLVLNRDLRVVMANRAFYSNFWVSREETEGRLVYDLGNRQWDIPGLRRLLEEVIPEHNSFDDFEVTHDFDKIGQCKMLLNARRVIRKENQNELILLAIEDITCHTSKNQTGNVGRRKTE